MNELKGVSLKDTGEFFSLKENLRFDRVEKEKNRGVQGLNPTENIRSVKDKKLMEVSRLYEKHFLRELVRAMRKTIPENDLTKPSFSEKMYKQKLDQEYVEKWGDQGGIGLAPIIYKNLKERLEGG